MKYLVFFFLFFIISPIKAQVHKYWIGDTAKVFWSYDTSEQTPVPDTFANVKRYLNDTVRGTTIEIFWNKEMTHPCSKYIMGGLGNDTTWYKNGNIDEITYWSGKGYTLAFRTMGWYFNGAKKIETIYKDNEKIYRYYYKNGNIKRIETEIKAKDSPYTDDYIWVFLEDRCENGNIKFKDSISFRFPRKWTTYYCNGNKRIEFISFVGQAYGRYTVWYDNGQIQEDGLYDDISTRDTNDLHYELSKKQGKWSFYRKDGKLEKEEFYKNDVLIDEKKY